MDDGIKDNKPNHSQYTKSMLVFCSQVELKE